MKNIIITNHYDDHYRSDCQRIVQIMNDRGYNCSIEQSRILWEKYSDSMAAGWMFLPDNDKDVFSCISSYFEEDVEKED